MSRGKCENNARRAARLTRDDRRETRALAAPNVPPHHLTSGLAQLVVAITVIALAKERRRMIHETRIGERVGSPKAAVGADYLSHMANIITYSPPACQAKSNTFCITDERLASKQRAADFSAALVGRDAPIAPRPIPADYSADSVFCSTAFMKLPVSPQVVRSVDFLMTISTAVTPSRISGSVLTVHSSFSSS